MNDSLINTRVVYKKKNGPSRARSATGWARLFRVLFSKVMRCYSLRHVS